VGKLITMAANVGGIPPDHEPFTHGSQEDIGRQIGYLLYDVREALGELRNAAKVSDDARKINDEKILQLFERTIRAETTLSDLKETVDRRNADLDGLGTRHNKDVSELKNDLNDLGRQLERRLNEAAQRIENSMNQMGRRLEEQIREPDRIAHTVASFGKFALAVIAGGGLTELIRYLVLHHF
jgi:chromosome segregation ATPase